MPIIHKSFKYSLLAIFLLLLFFFVFFTYEFFFPPKAPPGKAEFKVNAGKSVSTIAGELKANGIIKRKWSFLLGYRLFSRSQSIKAGEYLIETPASAKEVLHILIEGKVALFPITIPEGLTRLEIAEHLASEYSFSKEEILTASFNTAIISGWDNQAENLEGYLFPETYYFPRGVSETEIVERMTSQFKMLFSDTWKKRAQELGMTIREVVILGSLIEKETSLPEERELVSAVFHNRLRIGMKLDCDPTIVYALKQTGDYKGKLGYKDLKLDSPYNSYLHRGLPPGPIANPGAGSLKAALYSADVKYLYFVSKNDGSHYFSQTLREHQNAVNQYQKRQH